MNLPIDTLHHYFTTLGSKGGAKGSLAQQSARAQVFAKRWKGKPFITATQREILEQRALGRTFAEIAQARGTTIGAALNQSCSACHRLGIKGTTDAVAIRRALELSEILS